MEGWNYVLSLFCYFLIFFATEAFHLLKLSTTDHSHQPVRRLKVHPAVETVSARFQQTQFLPAALCVYKHRLQNINASYD